ncbi:MAG: hypothetical protein ACLRX7_06605 [Acutalibacteraceae bacterium]
MKKGHTVRKRPLALFMALIMVFGLLPVSGVFAATEQTEEDVVNGSTPQVTSQVKFLNSELTKAEIIYTVNPVKKETGSNIIFLVDASKAAYSTTVKNLVSAMQTIPEVQICWMHMICQIKHKLLPITVITPNLIYPMWFLHLQIF